MANVVDALQSLRPGAQWAVSDSGLASLVWLDQIQQRPTDAEINAEVTRLNGLPAPTLADKMDQVQFKIAFNNENRIRVLEGRSQLTAAQFKAALTTLLGG